jgi:hypothetical protein
MGSTEDPFDPSVVTSGFAKLQKLLGGKEQVPEPAEFYILGGGQPPPGGRFVELDAKSVQPHDGRWGFFHGGRYPSRDPIRIDASEVSGLDFAVDFGLVPFVSSRLAKAISAAAGEDVQLLETSDPGFELLQVPNVLDCLDHQRSKFLPYEATHPERAGKPMLMIDLCLRRSAVGAVRVFRVVDWEMPILVAASVAESLRALEIPLLELVPVRSS